NPLDDSIFASYPLWMELTVDGDPLEPRHPIQSVPYASVSGTAESVDGGTVNASEISINDFTVVDGDGNWMGTPINWNDLEDIPEDLFDGDADTQLQESEVEEYISNGVIDLFAESTIGGENIVSISHSTCTEGELLVWDGVLGAWSCEMDSLDALSLNCASDEIIKWDADALVWSCQSDNDTQLSTTDVIAIVESNDLQSAGSICDSNGCIGDSLWEDLGGTLYYGGSYVSIGTTTPTATLTVDGSISASNGIEGTLTTADQSNVTALGTLVLLAISGDLTVGGDTLYVNSTNQNVGIGTTTPASTLDVNGTLSASSIAGSIITPSQPNITELGTIQAGTWEASTITDAYIDNALTIDGGSIDNSPIGANTPADGSFTSLRASDGIEGTLTTADQSNVTALGTLVLLAISGDLTVGGDTLYVDSTNQSVGIGTTAPASTLEVAGVVHSTTGGIKFPDGTTQSSAASGEGYKEIWSYYDYGSGHNTKSESWLWGDWVNARITEGSLSHASLYQCNMTSSNGAHNTGISFKISANISYGAYKDYHRVFDIEETNSGWVGGCGAAIHSYSEGVNNAGGFSYTNTCTQTITCRCIKLN
ncbi:MAG: hypothetical protein VX278_01220, partial [Myxococcota bacterium]|nr:hypothetical protein [Myxococcota bacterium]